MKQIKLTNQDISLLRGIDGFPNAMEEDIINISDTPLYTICPNPFIEEYLKEVGSVYDENTDQYCQVPFAADVSEGKNDPIYVAHSYHTKVPYKAIMRYILHYTKPGDVVLDGFCGTGMTGVAAQMCGNPTEELKLQIESELKNVEWGDRKAILSDISPVATYIAYNYNKGIDIEEFYKKSINLLEDWEEKCGWMYETRHVKDNGTLDILESCHVKGRINYVVWSDVLVCPSCSEEIVFYNAAFDKKENKVKDIFICQCCGRELKKTECARVQETIFDDRLKETISIAKQVPVLINYLVGNKRYTKTPDKYDIDLIERINNMENPYWYPTDKLPEGCNTEQPKNSHGITHVHLFYTKRSLYCLGYINQKIGNSPYKIVLQSIIATLCSKLTRYNMGNRGNGPMTGTLYVPSLVAETDIIKLFRGKLKDFIKVFSLTSTFTGALVQCNSATQLKTIPSNSIDYIFTDPPFGDNINYSELSFIWESWLKVKTNIINEAIVNKVQNKGTEEYHDLMNKCFEEYYRVLKPNRWITVEFHNSKNSIWNIIQESLSRAGFIVASVKTLDKKQGSFKQVTTSSAVKQDLIISAYKPKDCFKKRFLSEAGTIEGVWDFIDQHLERLPRISVDSKGMGIVAERQKYLLYDAMIAYHIQQGIYIPIDASEFYKGLEIRYIKRDDMYFLADQVAEYDEARGKYKLNIQLSYIITNERDAVGFLMQELTVPQTKQELHSKYIQILKPLKYEQMPELEEVLKDNFLQDENGKWYIPDITKQGDIEKLREKKLLRQFDTYLEGKGKLKTARIEAIQAGFKKAWKEKDFETIVKVGNRLPDSIILEDQKLFMYYDNAKLQVEE